MRQLRVKKGQPYPLGATIKNNGINFSMVNRAEDECGLILYQKNSGLTQKIPFEKSHRIGNISCFFVEGLLAEANSTGTSRNQERSFHSVPMSTLRERIIWEPCSR